MKLILVRHGEAEPAGAGGDSLRKLTAKGRADIERLGRLLRGTGWNFVEIVTSPLVRTVETGAILAGGFGSVQARSDERLAPGVDPRSALDLAAVPGPSDAMVWVFHAPDVGMVASALTSAPPGGLFIPPGTGLALNLTLPQPLGRSMLVFSMPPEYLASWSGERT